MKYFGYGSNMGPEGMKGVRFSKGERAAPRGWRLEFSKRPS